MGPEFWDTRFNGKVFFLPFFTMLIGICSSKSRRLRRFVSTEWRVKYRLLENSLHALMNVAT